MLGHVKLQRSVTALFCVVSCLLRPKFALRNDFYKLKRKSTAQEGASQKPLLCFKPNGKQVYV